eukprot:scaffold14497_cov119-Cylindrotheca_fusiformis.AAC.5
MSIAFQTYSSNSYGKSTQLGAFVDPDLVSTVSSHISHSELHTLLSTMFSTTNLHPATGHSYPPPDQYLSPTGSVMPKVLADMGISQAKTASDLAPDASAVLQQRIAAAMEKGIRLLDGSKMMNVRQQSLPGFSENHGAILPTHNANVPAETPASFAAEVKWAAKYFDVMDKLPFAAFWYCIVEFAFLRPGIDFYKEDIEADPTGALADTMAVAIVRVMAFAIIAFLTVVLFG